MLRADLVRMHIVELAAPLVASLHALFSRHPLRTGDALHLAAAIILREGVGTDVDFVGYDDRLCSAARLEGFRVRP